MAMNATVAMLKRKLDRAPRVMAAIVIALVLTPALVKLIFYPAYPGPDGAFLHIAVAEHILDGTGWGVNSHHPVNLSSSPIFVLLLVSILAIGSMGVAQIFSVVFACAALAITFFATRAITASSMCGLAALVVAAANVHLWRWSGTVMEPTLAYLAVTLISATTLWLVRARRTSVWNFALLGALIGFGTLVRFEIGILLPLSMGALWVSRQHRIPPARRRWRRLRHRGASVDRVRHQVFRIADTDNVLRKGRRPQYSSTSPS